MSEWHRDAALNYATVIEVVFSLATAVPLIALSRDLSDDTRGLCLTYPLSTARFAFLRLTAAWAWTLAWLLGGLVAGDLLGFGMPVLRDVGLLVPEGTFVLCLAFAVSEWAGEPAAAVASVVIIAILGLGIPGLPFAQPALHQLVLFDARGQAPGAGLWDNRLGLLALAVALALAGTVGLSVRRRRGSYAVETG